MPRKTDGEKVDGLMVSVTQLQERFDRLSRDVAELASLEGRVVVLERRAAILEHQVADLRQGRERWLDRLWMLLAPLVGAVAGSLLTYFLAIKK